MHGPIECNVPKLIYVALNLKLVLFECDVESKLKQFYMKSWRVSNDSISNHRLIHSIMANIYDA